jgi:hypothetical protein
VVRGSGSGDIRLWCFCGANRLKRGQGEVWNHETAPLALQAPSRPRNLSGWHILKKGGVITRAKREALRPRGAGQAFWPTLWDFLHEALFLLFRSLHRRKKKSSPANGTKIEFDPSNFNSGTRNTQIISSSHKKGP